MTSCAIPFSGAKTTCCKTRNCIALLLAAVSLVTLPQDKEPAVQGWLMLSGVDWFNFHAFSKVLCLIDQSGGVWDPGACLVNCFVQSCALCFLRRGWGGRGGGRDVLYIHLQISSWGGRVGCKDLHLQLLYSLVYCVLLWVSHSKAYCGNFPKKLCIPSSCAVQLVLGVNDT